MAIDKKLCMLKNDFNKSPLKDKLENGTITLDDINENFKEIDFKNRDDKNDYYIVELSFFFHNRYVNSDSIYEDNLLLINRNVIGFDGKPRVSKGLSFLFSLTPKSDCSLIKQFEDKIIEEFTFIGLDNEQLSKIDLEFIGKGQGYNKVEGRANYIFFVYEVLMNKEIKDIIQIKTVQKRKDIDFVFQVDGQFIYNTYKYFLNPKLHFDITIMKSLSSNKAIVSHKNAKFFKNINDESTKKQIILRQKNLIEDIKAYILEKGSNIIIGIMNEITEHAANPNHALIELWRCMATFGIGAFKGLDKVL